MPGERAGGGSAPHVIDEVIAPLLRTADGDSGVWAGFGRARLLIVELAITAVTAITDFDLYVEDTFDGTNWRNIAGGTTPAIANVTTAARYFATIYPGAPAATGFVNASFTDRLRFRWDLTGTNATFGVKVYSETPDA